MRPKIAFITGTDTGVGKTFLAALLALHLREAGHSVAALKPIASGNRADGRCLRRAVGNGLTLDEINPWHFRKPLAPLLAARCEGRRVTRDEVVAHVRAVGQRFEVLLVEGAGGLLSPLGGDFDSRNLIVSLSALPIIIAPNRLGVLNQVLLTLEALPPRTRRRAQIVLMQPRRPSLVSRMNLNSLRALARSKIHLLPWLGEAIPLVRALRRPQVHSTLVALERALL